jgi:hypothetical protein
MMSHIKVPFISYFSVVYLIKNVLSKAQDTKLNQIRCRRMELKNLKRK